jgi:hypothetical protein
MARENPVPAARTERLVIEEVGDETLVYDLDRHAAHTLNRPAALVWKACDGKKTLAELAEAVPGELSPADRRGATRLALDQLSKAHLLAAPVVLRAETISQSRRALLLKIGIAASVALIPLVTSVGVPPAYAQQSPSTVLLLDGSGFAEE